MIFVISAFRQLKSQNWFSLKSHRKTPSFWNLQNHFCYYPNLQFQLGWQNHRVMPTLVSATLRTSKHSLTCFADVESQLIFKLILDTSLISRLKPLSTVKAESHDLVEEASRTRPQFTRASVGKMDTRCKRNTMVIECWPCNDYVPASSMAEVRYASAANLIVVTSFPVREIWVTLDTTAMR